MTEEQRRDRINELGGYQKLFDAISAAVEPWPSKEQCSGISVSVFKFVEALSAPSSPGDGCPEPAAVWRVCRVIKPECQKCPASELIDGEAFQRGCYLQAVEVINTVQTGNPWRKTADELGPSKIWTAYTAAPSSLGDGWVVVPREPTDAMIDAPRKIILDDRMRANNGRTKAGLAIDIYRAMLSAAPSPGGDHG